jgi:uncharacterized protein
MEQLISNTEQHIRSELASRDASHDFTHIERVRKMALHLGRMEGLPDDSLLIIEVAALLHDIRDWKYAKGPIQCCHTPSPQMQRLSQP